MSYVLERVDGSDISILHLVMNGHGGRLGEVGYNQKTLEEHAKYVGNYLIHQEQSILSAKNKLCFNFMNRVLGGQNV